MERPFLGATPGEPRLTRRRALAAFGTLGLAAALSACGGAASGGVQPAATSAAPASTSAAAATTAAATTAASTSAAATASAAPATTSAGASSTAASSTIAASAPAANGQQTVLNWFLPLSAAPEIAIWTQFVTRFQQAHPDIKINGAYEAWGDYWTKLTTVMAGGAIPDVIWLHYTRMAEWASKDVMIPLDSHLAADKLDPKQYVFNDAMVYKGKMYAIPKDNGVNAMWFNKTMYQKAGAKDPTFQYAWKDWLADMLKATLDKSGKMASDPGFTPSSTVQWGTTQPQANSPRGEGFYSWFAAMGGKLYSDDMTQTMIDQPESVAALQFMADIVAKQHVAPQPGAISQPGDPWLNQLIATTWAHHAEEFYYHDQKKDFPYDEVYYPQGEGGKLVISGGATGFAIPKQSKHPDQAWTLTTFMTGEDQQKVIVAQHRWAAGLRKLVPTQYVEGYNTPNYVKCHVDPLTGNGPQAVAAPSPAALAQIEQVWGTMLDPVWLGKQQAKDVVTPLKQQMDQLLQQKTPI